ncbi:MAG TPA: FAD-dependent monooxygenase, partial [Solirubrobacteraceae bacterium]
MLLDKLAASGLCEVRRGTELIGLSQDAYGVTANVRDRSHNTERSVRAAYLVGADGAYSTIRAQLGIAMRGHDHLTRELNILFDDDLRSVLGKVRAILYHVRHPWLPAPCQFRNTDGGSRWSLLSHYFEDPSHERCGELVRLCAVDPELKVEILAVGEWERAALLADHFREGRVFLTGDAVHRVTPAGAFGMNTAIQTAHNLAWKLAAVLRGWAGPGLLDTYEAERRPWTGQTVDLSYRLQAQHEQAGQSTEAALRAALIGRGIVEPGDLEASVTGYRDGSAARARVAQQAARRPDLEGALETRRRAEVVAADAARRHQQAGQALGEAAREQRLEADDPSSALSALVQWEAANRERMEKARRQVSARAELDTLLAGGTYDELLREADQERRRAEAAMADLPQDGVDTEAALPDLEARLSDARANAQAAQVAAAAARGELKQLSAAPANVSECEEAFVAAQAELQRVRRLDVTLTMTREFLERAQERVHRDIAPVLEQTLREWLPLV